MLWQYAYKIQANVPKAAVSGIFTSNPDRLGVNIVSYED